MVIGGVPVARNSRVIMQPGSRRADAQDLFLTGRQAIVEAVLFDVDGQVHLAVTPADDPAADLHRTHGRFLYFAPDEVIPLAGRVNVRKLVAPQRDAGFFGQNFAWLVDRLGGWPTFGVVGLGTEALAVAALYWLFRRRGWIAATR